MGTRGRRGVATCSLMGQFDDVTHSVAVCEPPARSSQCGHRGWARPTPGPSDAEGSPLGRPLDGVQTQRQAPGSSVIRADPGGERARGGPRAQSHHPGQANTAVRGAVGAPGADPAQVRARPAGPPPPGRPEAPGVADFQTDRKTPSAQRQTEWGCIFKHSCFVCFSSHVWLCVSLFHNSNTIVRASPAPAAAKFSRTITWGSNFTVTESREGQLAAGTEQSKA